MTLQPIRRYGFDAAILFADILLLPQALGADLWFVTGEGPRLSTITSDADFDKLGRGEMIHDTLNPIYQTVRNLSGALPSETTLIGFAGAPWTVATYMIAGQGTKDQGPAHALKAENRALFEKIIDRLTEATIDYLSEQVKAGAEVVKLFDSWAGSLKGEDFDRYALEPARIITQELKRRHPGLPVIAFPRQAGDKYIGFHQATGADCVAVDDSVTPEWAGSMCRCLAVCRATLPRHTWSRAAMRSSRKRSAWCRPSATGRISSTLATGSRRMRTPRMCS